MQHCFLMQAAMYDRVLPAACLHNSMSSRCYAGFSVVGMVLMAIAENLVRMSLCNRFPALQYSDTHVRAMREPAPLPKSLNLGVGDKLAGVDFPGKPIQSGPPSKDTFSSYADNPAKV